MSQTAEQLRDEGIEQVTESNASWAERTLEAFENLNLPHQFTGEDIRLALEAQGHPKPAHPNAWGAIINQLVGRGKVRPSGQWTKMKSKKSHARQTRLYFRVQQQQS